MRSVLKLLRWPLIITGGLLGVFAVLLAGVYLYINTAGGQAWLAAQLEKQLNSPGELEVSIGRLGGQIPQNIELEDLSVSDGEGQWLSLESLRLTWQPLALLERRLVVDDLEARSLNLARLPKGGSAEDSEGGGIPSLPVTIRLRQVDIEDVRLGAPVLGEPVAFDLKGRARSLEDDTLQADFALERTDGVTGSASVKASFQPNDRQLRLNATVQEDRGGLIALLLDEPDLPPISAALTGSGALDDWSGKLSGEIPSQGALDAQVRLTQGDELALSTQGTLSLEKLPDEPYGALLAGGLTFDLAGRWDGADNVAVDKAALASKALALDLLGTVDISSLELDATLNAKVLDDKAIVALLDGVELAGLDLTLEAKGPALQPALALEATTDRLADGDIRAEGLTLEATFQPEQPLDQDSPVGALTAKAKANSLSFESSGDVAALIGQRFDVALEGHLDLAQDQLKADRLTVETEQIKGDGSLQMNLADGSGDGDLTASVASLSPLERYLDMAIGGRADLSAKLALKDFGGDLRIDLTGTLNDVTIEEAIAAALLAGEQKLAAKLHIQSDRLSISDLSLRGPGSDLAGDLTLTEDFEQLASTYRLTLPKAAMLAQALGLALEGAAQLDGTAEGPVTDLALKGKLALDKAVIEGQALGTLTVDYTAQELTTTPSGHLAFTAQPALGPTKGAADYRLEGETFTLSSLKLESRDTVVTGQVAVPVNGGPLTAELAAEAKSLAPWLAAAGMNGDGAAQLTATLRPDGAKQAASVTGKVSALTLDLEGSQLAAEAIDATADLQDLLAKPAGKLDIKGTRIAYDTIILASARLQAEGALDAAAFELEGAGLTENDPTLNAAGKIARAGDQLTLDLARFTGALSGQKLALRAPTTITLAENEISVGQLDLDLGSARLTAAGRVDRSQLTAKLELSEFPLDDLEPLVPDIPSGQVSAKLDVAGPLDSLAGTIGLTGRSIKLLEHEDSQTLDFNLDGNLARGTLDLKGHVDTGIGQDAMLTGSLPIAIDPENFTVELPPRKPISGQLAWAGDLAELWDVFGLVGQDLKGRGQIDMKVSGTLDDPRVAGQATITQGRYENFQVGTVLQDLTATVDFSGEEAVLSQLSANDGAGGKVSAQGSVKIEPQDDFPLSVTANMRKVTLVRRDDVTGSADGDLELSGTLQAAKLTGQITTERVEISVAQSLPPQVVDLQVEMVNFPQSDTAQAEQNQAAAAPFDLGLDLKVNMPRRVFVRGKGLDTEWSGDLDVKGTAAKPQVIGRMTLVRGTVDVIGKQFSFDRGQISFDGGDKIDPLIDIEATSKAKDIEVTVDVSGTATDPEIELTSVPEVPEDEMISQLLFGKSTNELSTFELVQVGAAVAQLSGALGDGAGILDTTRGLLGVDVLRLDSTQGADGSSNPALSVGKYVTDGVYLGVKQGATADSSSVTVDVDLTDNIAIGSDVKETGDSNIGVRFQWDY
ncbi:MAG: translocation/assembly module TamB domain-containing protein [Pseudomonadota bacterium]